MNSTAQKGGRPVALIGYAISAAFPKVEFGPRETASVAVAPAGRIASNAVGVQSNAKAPSPAMPARKMEAFGHITKA